MNIICSYVRIISNKDPFNATIYLIVLYFHRMSLINCIFSISFFIYINGYSQIKRRNISNRLMAIGVRLYFSLILQKYVRAFFYFVSHEHFHIWNTTKHISWHLFDRKRYCASENVCEKSEALNCFQGSSDWRWTFFFRNFNGISRCRIQCYYLLAINRWH